MSADNQFASLVASLRAPRVALCVDDAHFVRQTSSAMRVHAQLWGGVGNVVISTLGGKLHPAVARALAAYDPDHLSVLGLTYPEIEVQEPGVRPLHVDGELVTDPTERASVLAQMGEYGPQVVEDAVDEQSIERLRGTLATFDDDGESRVSWLHPGQIDDTVVSTIGTPDSYSAIETGDPILDLAVGLRRGVPVQSSGPMTLSETQTISTCVDLLLNPAATDDKSPFAPTAMGLTRISAGGHRPNTPIVVLGRTGSDMSLATTLDRHRGNTAWLPVTADHGMWLKRLGDSLKSMGSRSYVRELVVTSTSLNDSDCKTLFEQIQAAGFIPWPADRPIKVTYVPADHVPLGRTTFTWRVENYWDRRFTAPVTTEGGSTTLVSPPPLDVPEWFDIHPRKWITEVTHDRRPVLRHPGINADHLRAPNSNHFETFIRASHGAVAFESARWDLVLAGSSHFGQLARPRLRWPGIRESLNLAAQTAGLRVRPSAPGKIAQLTTLMWGGRTDLITDLLPARRPLVDRLLTEPGEDRPLEKEADAPKQQPRIRKHGRCLVPFPAFDGLADPADVRAWLDTKVSTGAVRTGIILNCGVCPFGDFYPIDNVGSTFTCARCGSVNALTSERWRKPAEGPIWYFELHPTAAEFFATHSDAALLATHHHPATQRTDEVDYELEFINTKSGKAEVEVDFAIMGWDGLILGEAKSNGALKGANEKARVAEVAKKFKAATASGATEVCFATTGSWSQTAINSFQAAIAAHQPSVTVTTLEHIETTNATHKAM